jgi:Ca2+-binding RTX toxin-like protein
MVFADGDGAGATGQLGAISSAELTALTALYSTGYATGLAASQFGEIDGLNMGYPPGSPLTITRGLVNPLTFAGGITYTNLQIVDVMLGSGDDNFTVSNTVPQTITTVQGGGGNNTLTATGGGGYDAPLVLAASTTQNGQYYNSTTQSLTGWAREFTYPDPTSGHSLLDASQDPNSVILYGGRGNTYIYGGGGGDQIFGGGGTDFILAGSGNDIIRANDGLNLDLTHPLAQVVAENLNALIVTHDPSASDSPTGDPLTPVMDSIYGGIGHDIVFLDHGNVDQLSNPITGTVGVLDAYTTDPVAFGLSSVYGASNGSMVVLAGTGRQTINLGHTSQANVVVKNGYVYFAQPDSWTSRLLRVGSTSPGAGGNDRITLGDGNDVVVAGTGFDQITGGDGNKVILADDGEVIWSATQLQKIVSQDPGVSADSTDANSVVLGNGNDVIFGGSGANTITAGNGNDVVAGANGELDFQNGVPTTFESTDPTYGANNKITLGSGSGVVIGGPGSNQISAGPGYAVIAGNGQAEYSAGLHSWLILSPAPPAPPVVTQPASSSPALSVPASIAPIVLVVSTNALVISKPKAKKAKKAKKPVKKPVKHKKSKSKTKQKPKAGGATKKGKS